MAVGGAIAGTKQRSGHAAEEAPDLPRVTWYKHAGLIKLYAVRPLTDLSLTVAASDCYIVFCNHGI